MKNKSIQKSVPVLAMATTSLSSIITGMHCDRGNERVTTIHERLGVWSSHLALNGCGHAVPFPHHASEHSTTES